MNLKFEDCERTVREAHRLTDHIKRAPSSSLSDAEAFLVRCAVQPSSVCESPLTVALIETESVPDWLAVMWGMVMRQVTDELDPVSDEHAWLAWTITARIYEIWQEGQGTGDDG